MKKAIPAIIIILVFSLLIYQVIKKPSERNQDVMKAVSQNTFEPKIKNQFLPEETPEPAAESKVCEEPVITPQEPVDPIKEFINSMTLEEKIGQLFICAFRKDSSGAGYTRLSQISISAIEDYHIGGIVFFSENIESSEQIQDYIESAQGISAIPLFIAIDEEGGRVRRTQNLNLPYIESQESAALKGSDAVFENSLAIGAYLKPLGFNMDFAPVGDINSNPLNTVVGDRAYGNNSQIVCEMIEKAIKGFEESGIISVAKHFPGHGDTSEDSHNGMAQSSKSLDELRQTELKPFIAAANAGIPTIMAGHISCPKVNGNDEPAVFSKILITDVLRKEIGFEGLIITDAMDMGAISKFYESGEACVKALKAGVDIILMAADFTEGYKAVLDAVNSGEIPVSDIDEKLYRIIYTKNKYLGYDFEIKQEG